VQGSFSWVNLKDSRASRKTTLLSNGFFQST